MPVVCSKSTFLSSCRVPKFPHLALYDILVAAKDQASMQETKYQIISAVEKAGLTAAKEKIQTLPPWKYLGHRITEQTVTPQPLQLRKNSKTLSEVQQLVGTLNWLRPLLGISNQDLNPLSDLLKRDTTLNSPQEFNKEAQNALDKVMRAIQSLQAH